MGSATMPETFTISPSNNDTNQTTCDTLYNHRDYTRIIMPLFYSIMFFMGLFGNCLALYVIYLNPKKINASTLYSLNLVISDILLILLLPVRIAYFAMGFHWPLGEVMCKISALIFYINTYAGLSFMACLSVNRFIAVVWPLRFTWLRIVRHARFICVGVWLLVLAQTLPLLGMHMTHEEPEGFITCMEYPNFEAVDNIAAILIGAVFLGYVIPVVTILVCYSVSCFKLRKVVRYHKAIRNSIGVICCASLVSVICYSPYHINILQYMIRKLVSNPDCADLTAFQVSVHITMCLMNLNTCLDPFIYLFSFKGYRRKVLMMLKLEVGMSFSSAVRTSPVGSSKDYVDKIQLNSFTMGTTKQETPREEIPE